MTATDHYRAGRLQEAIEAQVQQVKAHPADQRLRLFLFELLAFAGDWERARRQIDAVQHHDVDLDVATQTYRGLLDGESARRQLFADGTGPRFLTEPPAHIRTRLEAVAALRADQPAQARQLLEQADAAAPAPTGTLNGKPFTLLRDCDDVFGPVFEVLAHGGYFWVPLEQVESLQVRPPRFPRDLLWLPARLEAVGSAGDVFLPVLYPGSALAVDNAIRLGRSTDWQTAADGPVRGLGMRTFLVDDDVLPLPEWREFRLG